VEKKGNSGEATPFFAYLGVGGRCGVYREKGAAEEFCGVDH